MPAKTKHKSFEAALNRLEEITEALESGEKTLEESIELYSEGLAIAKECHERLNQAEQKIKLVVQKDGAFPEVDFDETEPEA